MHNEFSARVQSDLVEYVQEIQQRLNVLQLGLEDVQVAHMPNTRTVGPWSVFEREDVDYDSKMRQYFGLPDADDIITPEPSMQVSTMYHTAATDLPSEGPFNESHQIGGSVTLHIYDIPMDTSWIQLVVKRKRSILHVKRAIHAKIHIPINRFQLGFDGKVFRDEDILRDCVSSPVGITFPVKFGLVDSSHPLPMTREYVGKLEAPEGSQHPRADPSHDEQSVKNLEFDGVSVTFSDSSAFEDADVSLSSHYFRKRLTNRRFPRICMRTHRT